ncbi:YhcN/YlaJ family sporulation lipoprotein [Paenibacillus mendelii]|uniref:YhcN/YlaJ family sporulation lipoprotein n=1 Tax=Paenibacillus mendelii TaxID=206163 RepID=A0ABV6JBY5_9BACL|nr:YhcN/YlaJ family sporulation lipoprotein [Paenibacillus mendelii]MCQ6559733.1 YhcN/YlaJ family sporulation lipoprotein [Paenibacillus mendelii]
MHRKWVVLAAGAMLGTMLTGCMEKTGDLGNRNIRENSVRYDMNGNRIMNKRFANDQMNEMNRLDGRRLNSNNLVGLHRNYRLEMSQEVAERLSSMKGVSKAYVMLTDNNAYVAVSLDDKKVDKTGVSAKGMETEGRSLSRTNDSYLPKGMTGIKGNGARMESSDYDMLGTRNGMNATRSFDDKKTYTNRSLYRTYKPNQANKDYPRGAGTFMNPSSAHRMKSMATNETETIGTLKDRIAKEVKISAPQIKNVYVSANPDFVSRMTSYMEDVRLGQPIQGFIVEFNAMVDRIFPAESGTTLK